MSKSCYILKMRILAIETSCDETAIAIADFSGTKNQPRVKVWANVVSSQVKLHARYGGVVPNLAKREHQKNLVPVLLKALEEAGLNPKVKTQKSKLQVKIKKIEEILQREDILLKRFKKEILKINPPEIGVIAVTVGPGLEPALWVGVNFAKALAHLWHKPLTPVNHMEGHIYSAFLQPPRHSELSEEFLRNSSPSFRMTSPVFPTLALLVSGGHTELVLVKDFGKYQIIGETLDDAAGECFDKAARLLGLPYPGGPEIAKLAEGVSYSVMASPAPEQIRYGARNDPTINITLPRPMLNSKDFNFSFSGLKTAVLYLLRDLEKQKIDVKKLCPAIAREFQDAVIEVLIKKTLAAAKEYKPKTIILGGGVAANKRLRKEFETAVKKNLLHVTYLLSPAFLTGDNALMITLAAFFTGKKKDWNEIKTEANLKLGK